MERTRTVIDMKRDKDNTQSNPRGFLLTHFNISPDQENGGMEMKHKEKWKWALMKQMVTFSSRPGALANQTKPAVVPIQ